jgi:hypothetical protein
MSDTKSDMRALSTRVIMGNKVDMVSARFLSTKELSELLRIPEGTLRQWRCSEVGPKWHKLRGSVRYDRTDVESFSPRERAYSVCAGTHGGTPCLYFVPKIVLTGGTRSTSMENGTARVRRNKESRCSGC